ncbi:PKD domain-containing protein [Candidatus Microgenomates bacterium]|nr:PKD domain-containing protein [Candidatus Microgenomates bacterium]
MSSFLNALALIPMKLKVSAVALAMVSSMLLPIAGVRGAQIRECIPNSVINCGVYTKAEFANKVRNGDGRQTAAQLQRDFNMLSISIAEMQAASTVSGVVTKSGNVIVNGKVVANKAFSFGRNFKPGSVKVGSLWKRPTTVSFQSSQLEAFVYMKDGVFQWAVLKACGNPIVATPIKKPAPKPSFICEDLSIVAVNGRKVNTDQVRGKAPLTVKVLAKGSVKNAKITGYTFRFGDGSGPKLSQDARQTHTYKKIGKFTANVVIKTNKGSTKVVDRCKVTIKTFKKNVPPVKPPQEQPPVVPTKGELPNTGPAAAAAGGGMASAGLGIGIRAYLRSRKSLLSSLLDV